MKKNPNLIHLLESFALSALLCFFLFFMKRGEDAFFTITLGFSAFAFLFVMLMIYIDGDKPDRGVCKLITIARSDLAFYVMLLQYILAGAFAIWHNLADISIPAVTVIYALLPIAELLIILIPAPKEEPAPVSAHEGGLIKSKSLDYYATQLRKLIQKSTFESLSNVMEKTADLLTRLDPEFSVQLDSLENDISHKCVKIENALLTNNGAQLLLLERELSATVELIEKRCAGYKYCLTDEGFYCTDDEIAMTQIDLLLDKLGLEYEEDLSTLKTPFDNEFFYKKALRFASEDYAALLASYNTQIVENLKKEAALASKRAQKRSAVIQIGCHAVTMLLVIAIAGVTLLWHTVIQPGGLRLAENENGTLKVIGYNPFYGDELTVPSEANGKAITVIGKEALMGYELTELSISEGIEVIEYQAIRDCSKLETIILPKSLVSIGNYVFKNDAALAHIYYRGSDAEWEKVTIGNLGNDEFKAIEVESEYKN